MARIPESTLKQSRFSGVQVPQGVYGNPTKALSRVVGAANNAADTVVRMMDDAQNVKNKSDVRTRLRDLRNMQTEFQNGVSENNTPPEEWLPQWEQQLNLFENRLGSEDMPQVVKDAVTEKFLDVKGASMLQIGGASVKENRRRAKEIGQLDVVDMMEIGDRDGAIAVVDEMVDEGTLDDHGAEIAKRGVKIKMDANARELTLFNDPVLYKENLISGAYDKELSPLQIGVEKKKAERAISAKETDAVATMQQMIDNGMITNVAKLKESMDDWPEIRKSTRETLVKEFGNTIPLSVVEIITMRDKISEDYRAWTKGEIDTGTYITRYNETQTTLAAWGKRQGAWQMRQVASRLDPGYKMNENGVAPPEELSDAQEQKLKEKVARAKTVADRAFTIIATRAAGRMSEKIAGKEFSEDDDVDKQVFKNEQKEVSLMFRVDMEDRMTEWLASLQTPPNMQEIISFIDDNQAQVIEGVIVKTQEARKINTDVGETPGRQSETKALEYLGENPNSASNILLPPKP